MQQQGKSCNPFSMPQTQEDFNCNFFRMREKEVNTCRNIMQSGNFLMLSGNAGVGKSYFARCGLIPKLKEQLHEEDLEAVHISFTPGEWPVANLATKLSQGGVLHNEKDADEIFSLTIEENLRNDDYGLVQVLNQADNSKRRFIICVDHLEELFKNPAFDMDADFQEEVRLFFRLFLRLAESVESIAYTVFVLRSKFLIYSDYIPELSLLINKGFYSLPQFTREEIKLIMEYRLQQCSLVLSGALKERLYADIDTSNYTFRAFNHAMYRAVEFWRADSIKENVIDDDYYLKTGGVGEALHLHAEKVFSQIKKEGLELVAERIFRLLVNAQTLKFPLLRVLSVKRLSELSGFSVDKVLRMLQTFRHAGCPVLKYSDEGALNEATTIQVTDTYMINYWKRLRKWYEQEHVSITIYLWLEKNARAYFKHERGLYQDPVLTETIQWRERERPSKAWARLYKDNYDTAMEYLRLSEEARRADDEKQIIASKKRNNRIFYGIVGAMMVLALLFAIYGLISQQRASLKKEQAAQSQRKSLSNNLVLLARKMKEKDPTMALRLAQKADGMNSTKDIKNTIRRIYSENNLYSIVADLPKEVRALKLSPNEKFIVAASGNKAYILDMNGRKLNVLSAHNRLVNAVDVSNNGKYILTGSVDNTCIIWNLNGEPLHVLSKHTRGIEACGFSPKSRFIVSSARDGKAMLWNARGKHLKTFDVPGKYIYDIAFSPDGSKILMGSSDSYAWLYSIEGELIRKYQHPWDKVFTVGFSNSGNQIVTANRYNFYLWNINGERLKAFKGHKNYINKLYFSPDDRYILSVSSDKTIKLWDTQGILLQEFLGHNHRILAADIFKNGKKLITGSKDNTIKLWNIDYNKLLVYKAHKEDVCTVVPSPGGLSFLSASWDNTARLFHPLSGTITIYKGHESDISRALLFNGGTRVLTAADDGTVIMWKKNGDIIRRYNVHDDVVAGLAISPDEKYFATSSWDNTARLWNWDGELLQEFTGHLGSVYDVAFSPGGKYICTGSRDQTARIWDLNGNMKNILRGHTARINDVEFSPDGNHILTASWDNSAILWDKSGYIIQRLTGHENYVNAVDFAHSGDYIVTASFDNTAKLWDMKGNELQSFKGHTDFVRDASFSIEDKFVLTASADQSTRIWKISKPGKNLLDDANIELLTRFQLFRYNIIGIEELVEKANEQELLKAAAYCRENSLNFYDNRKKLQWLKKAVRIYEKAYTFYHRNSIKEKIAKNYAHQIKVYSFLNQYGDAMKAYHKGIDANSEEKLLRRYKPLVFLLNGSKDIAINAYKERMYKPYEEGVLFRELFVADIETLKNKGIRLDAFDEVLEILKD